MITKTKILIGILVVIIFVIGGFFFYIFANNEVFADEPSIPYSYQKIVGNDQYVFVMLTEYSDPLISSAGKQYFSSGLYTNDGSNVPIWTIDWYAPIVYVSSDGEHLARIGCCPSLKNSNKPDIQELAVAFYENGKLLKRYPISDLINNPSGLPKSVSHFQWDKDVSFDDTLSELTIITTEDNKYVFNVKSGEMITGEASPITSFAPEDIKENIIIYFLASLLVLGGIVVIIVMLRKRKAEKTN